MIHRYQKKGLNFVLDVNSGAVHLLDDISYAVSGLIDENMTEKCPESVVEALPQYAADDVREAYGELYELKKAGQLFAEDDYIDVSRYIPVGAPVKALCLHVAHTCNLNCSYCFAAQGKFHGEAGLMSFETGKMCCQAGGSVLVRYGETTVLVNATASAKPRDGIDFLPLSVDFEEKLYAVGKIPGSFLKREGRPSDKAVLSSRVVDRPIRPLFPKDMRNDVSVVMTVLSVDPDCVPEIAGMIGASMALSISDIPWNGPIAGINVGLVDGEIILTPNAEQRQKSDLQLTVAGTAEKVCMIEAGANEVDDDTMLEAIMKGFAEVQKMVAFIKEVQAEIGKPKFTFESMEIDHDLFEAIKDEFIEDVRAAMDTDDKNIRDERMLPIYDRLHAEYDEKYPEQGAMLDECIYKLQKYVVRRWLLDDGKRVDGRGMDEIRPLDAEVGIIPYKKIDKIVDNPSAHNCVKRHQRKIAQKANPTESAPFLPRLF